MPVSSLQHRDPAATLAKSLLEVWLSGDRYRLRLELEQISLTPEPAERDDQWELVELLKSVAWQMKEAPDLFTPRCESPRTGTWVDLLHHLSVAASPESVSI